MHNSLKLEARNRLDFKKDRDDASGESGSKKRKRKLRSKIQKTACEKETRDTVQEPVKGAAIDEKPVSFASSNKETQKKKQKEKLYKNTAKNSNYRKKSSLTFEDELIDGGILASYAAIDSAMEIEGKSAGETIASQAVTSSEIAMEVSARNVRGGVSKLQHNVRKKKDSKLLFDARAKPESVTDTSLRKQNVSHPDNVDVVGSKLRFEQSEEQSVKPEKQNKATANPQSRNTKSQNQQSQNTQNQDQQSQNTSSQNKRIQKKQLKNDYASALRAEDKENTIFFWKRKPEVKTESAKAAVSESLGEKVREILENHKGAVAVLISLLALFLIMISGFGTIGALFSAGGEALAQSTYQGSDHDIKSVDAAYSNLEKNLQAEIDRVEITHPGFNEYRYQLDEISHDSYALTSYLTALYGNYNLSDVENELNDLFDVQFKLSFETITEIRTKTVYYVDPLTGMIGSYEIEYEWRILVTKLTNKGLDSVARAKVNDDQLKSYELYQSCMGNRSYLFGDTATAGNIAAGGLSYEIPPEALEDKKFARMIEEAEKYLGYPYVWGGSSPSTSFDCSGFVSWVINHSGNGWNVGRATANSLMSYCTYVSANAAQPGDLIFFENTYDTAGASHVGIYVGDGMMIHCGNPIQYASIKTNYWQEHFLAFGRLR